MLRNHKMINLAICTLSCIYDVIQVVNDKLNTFVYTLVLTNRPSLDNVELTQINNTTLSLFQYVFNLSFFLSIIRHLVSHRAFTVVICVVLFDGVRTITYYIYIDSLLYLLFIKTHKPSLIHCLQLKANNQRQQKNQYFIFFHFLSDTKHKYWSVLTYYTNIQQHILSFHLVIVVRLEDKMDPITTQPSSNFGFQGENKNEGYVHGNYCFCQN